MSSLILRKEERKTMKETVEIIAAITGIVVSIVGSIAVITSGYLQNKTGEPGHETKTMGLRKCS
jgi:hypothetical protein